MRNIIIILNYNDYENTKELLNKISRYSCLYHIIVVDNVSSDGSYEKLLDFKMEKISVIRSDRNGGYSYGNNYGVLYAVNNFNHIDNIIISNPDVDFSEQTIREMEKCIKKENIALVGAVVKSFEGELVKGFAWKHFDYEFIIRGASRIYNQISKHVITHRSIYYDTGMLDKTDCFEVDTVAGCFFMIRLNTFLKVGLFDERCFLYCEEDILSVKLRKLSDECKKEVVATKAVVFHKGSGTINKNIKTKKTLNRYSYNSRILYMKEYLGVPSIGIMLYKLLLKARRLI